MKKCPYCAEEIQDEAIICRYCGHKIPTKNIMITGSSPEKKRNILYYLIGIIGILILALIVVIIVIGKEKPDLAIEKVLNTSTPMLISTTAQTPTQALCYVQAEDFIVDLNDILDEWNSAYSLALNTPRYGLSIAIQNLQEIRTSTKKMNPPVCSKDAQEKLIQHMDAVLKLLSGFLANESDAAIAAYRENAKTLYDEFTILFALVKSKNPITSSSPIPTAKLVSIPTEGIYHVKYEVSIVGEGACFGQLVWRNPRGDIEDSDFELLPWEKEYDMKLNDSAYISAKVTAGINLIKCTVYVNGVEWTSVTANESFDYITCSGTIGHSP